MKSIEERAKQIIKDYKPIISEYQIEDMLVEFAMNQQRADIECACRLVEDIVSDILARSCETWDSKDKQDTIQRVRKMIKEYGE